MLRLTMEQFQELQEMKGKKRKYGNHKTTIIFKGEEVEFDSEKEAMRAKHLEFLEKAGEISDLQIQKVFELQPGFKHAGHKIRPITYVADFYYYDETPDCRHCQDPITRWVVEDVKSEATRKDKVYQMKKKMLLYVQHREIKEI